MDESRVRHILQQSAGSACTIRGWVRTYRQAKNVSFIELNDGSCLSNLQIVCDANTSIADSDRAALQTGASVEAEGTLTESPGGKQSVELLAGSLRVIGGAPADSYPLQKKRHSFEFLREIAHLRPRTNTFGAVARVRNVLSAQIHSFFQKHDFLWIHTPIITSLDGEGAGNLFQVTTLGPAAVPKREDGAVDYRKDFFEKPSFLTVTGQLNVEAFASSHERVYTFGPTFRAENSNTSRHLAEFWMVEPELAFCDIDGNMDLAEDFLKTTLSGLLRESEEDMAFFDLRIRPGLLDMLKGVIEKPFVRITYTEAIAELEKSGKSFEFPVQWGSDLQSEHERFLTEELYGSPVVVTGYPAEIKAFYMKQNEPDDTGRRTVRAMDVLVPGLGEIIGGSEREDRYDTLAARMDELGLDREMYGWYLDLRKFGTVPHSGFGLGFERMLMYVTGMQNIRDVIPFPRTVGHLRY
ncbi:MAG: asparagine--tRNA ligase [Spirochaetaceae bacterium]|nr:MAG: asparagine--tRNA ligase [Spirochaetaceae bacterium]